MDAETRERFGIPATIAKDQFQLACSFAGCVNSTLVFLSKKKWAPNSLICTGFAFVATAHQTLEGVWYFEEYLPCPSAIGLGVNRLHEERDFAQMPGLS